MLHDFNVKKIEKKKYSIFWYRGISTKREIKGEDRKVEHI